MSRAFGSARPDHPDNYGRAIERFTERDLGELPDLHELSDEEVEAMWAQEQVYRAPSAPHRHEGCGHDCVSGACVVMCGLHDHLCLACELQKHDARGSRYRPLMKKLAQ